VAGLPLRTAIDHRLGEPLPHQLTNRPQAPPKTPKLYSEKFPSSQAHAVLAAVSRSYPPLRGRLPTCYSPVRHFQVHKCTLTFDLHVLSTPPAFILSQDQTLRKDSPTASQQKKSQSCPSKTRYLTGIPSQDSFSIATSDQVTLPLFSC
jgi:hypothetical protein